MFFDAYMLLLESVVDLSLGQSGARFDCQHDTDRNSGMTIAVGNMAGSRGIGTVRNKSRSEVEDHAAYLILTRGQGWSVD